MTRNAGGLAALAEPGYRRYYATAVLAMNATWIFRVLLSWSAWEMTRSPGFVGVVAAAGLLPVAVVGPLFGALIDRSDITRAYGMAAIGFVSCPLVFLGLLAAGWLTPIPLLILATAYGVVFSVHHPVRQSLGPRLVAKHLTSSVVALSALNFNAARVVAPAIGGFLIAGAGLAGAAVVAGLLYAPSLFLAPHLRPREVRRKGIPTRFVEDLAEGVTTTWQLWPLRRMLLLSVFALGPGRAVLELLSLIADGAFQRGAEGLGLMTSAAGAGALVAALMQILPRQWLGAEPWRILAGPGFVAGIALVLAPTFGLALAMVPILGFAGTYMGVALQAGLQARLEDDQRGRVMSLWMLSTTLSTSLLTMGISALSEWFGLGTAATSAFCLCALAVLAIEMRRGPDR